MGDKQLMAGETFNFLVPLAKFSEDDGGAWFVEGVASDTGLDLHGERIGVQGQESMAQWAKSGTVALGAEADHFKVAFNDDMGYLVDGRVSDSGEFFIKAELDKGMSSAQDLVHAISKKNKKLGLSVFGKITDFDTDDDGVNVINGVELTRVMVTTSPANPRTWLGEVAKSLDANDESDDEAALETAPDGAPDNAAKAWDGSASNYASTDEYCAACLIDVNSAAGKDEKAQSHCKLPVKDPGSDSYNFDGIKAAAGGRGITQIEKPDDVPQDDWDKAVVSAANTIIAQYSANDSVAPQSVYDIAGKERPEEGKSVSEKVDPRTLAKGMFMDALRRQEEAMADFAPLGDELNRVEGISNLVSLLWDVAYNIDWAQYDGAITGEEAAELLRESIGEFKAEVAAKAQPEQVENADDDTVAKDKVVEGQTEGPSQDIIVQEVPMSQQTGKSLSEIVGIFADDKTDDVQSSQAAPLADHQAVKTANQLAAVVSGIVSNGELTVAQKREAVALAMAGTMDEMEKALPAPQPSDALGDEAPPWAKKLFDEVTAMKGVVQKGVNVGAGSPETADSPTVVVAPTRKSQTIAASTVVQQPQTMRGIVNKLLGLTTVDEQTTLPS